MQRRLSPNRLFPAKYADPAQSPVTIDTEPMSAAPIKLTILGSGTSMGVPSLACHSGVCTSKDPHDNRLRPPPTLPQRTKRSIDTTPDFRQQALRVHLDRLDAILPNHGHADHIPVSDDIRPATSAKIRAPGLQQRRKHFASFAAPSRHVFDDTPRKARSPALMRALRPVRINGSSLSPFQLLHGDLEVSVFALAAAAYLTISVPAAILRSVAGNWMIWSSRPPRYSASMHQR